MEFEGRVVDCLLVDGKKYYPRDIIALKDWLHIAERDLIRARNAVNHALTRINEK